MNHSARHSSPQGRIWLFLRADLVSNQRSLLTLLAGLLLLLVAVPRIPVLFYWDYSGWAADWCETYDFSAMKALISGALAVYLFFYINRRIVHSNPTLFSTLPAALWEKLVGMGAFCLVVGLLGHLTALCTLALEYVLTPGFSHSISLYEVFGLPNPPEVRVLVDNIVYDSGLSTFQSIAFILAVLIGGAGAIILTFYMAIRIRMAFLGLVLLGFISTLILTLYAWVMYTIIERVVGPEYFNAVYDQSHKTLLGDIASITSLLYATGVTALVGWLTSLRLRTLSS